MRLGAYPVPHTHTNQVASVAAAFFYGVQPLDQRGPKIAIDRAEQRSGGLDEQTSAAIAGRPSHGGNCWTNRNTAPKSIPKAAI